MRRLGCGLLLAGALTPAVAADFETPWLRGSTTDLPTPAPYRIWSGFYGGGQLGVDFHGVDFRDAPSNAIASIVSQDAILSMLPVAQMPQLPSKVISSASAGGFLGYNYQIDDVVLGLEGSYNATHLDKSVADAQTRNYYVTYNQHVFAVNVNTGVAAAASYNQYGSFRARAAWAFGDFLPYAFVGPAVAQINTYQYTNVNYSGVDVTPQSGTPPSPALLPPVGESYTLSDTTHGKYVVGFSTGVGIDYALFEHVFLRGEFEYLQFGEQNGIKLDNVSARVGAGVKF